MNIKPKFKREKIIYLLLHYITLEQKDLCEILELNNDALQTHLRHIRSKYGIFFIKDQCATKIEYRLDNFDHALKVYEGWIKERHQIELRELKALQMTHETSYSYQEIAIRCHLTKTHVETLIRNHRKQYLEN